MGGSREGEPGLERRGRVLPNFPADFCLEVLNSTNRVEIGRAQIELFRPIFKLSVLFDTRK